MPVDKLQLVNQNKAQVRINSNGKINYTLKKPKMSKSIEFILARPEVVTNIHYSFVLNAFVSNMLLLLFTCSILDGYVNCNGIIR